MGPVLRHWKEPEVGKHSSGFLIVLVALFVLFQAAGALAADVTVFAAASLTDSLNDVGTAWKQKTGHSTVFAFAASSTLAKQIEASAYADVFISADTQWMDYLDEAALIRRDTRTDLLGNHLVLIAPKTSRIELKIAPRFQLAAALGDGRLAVADPDSVPAGIYARTALTNLGVWNSVADHLARGENVRAALAYVSRGEAPLGIVYTTDAMADPAVRIVGTFPENTHPPIVYLVALTKEAKPLAGDFLAFLRGPEASTIFAKAGFAVLAERK